MSEETFKQTGPELKFKVRDALLAVITVGGMRDVGPHLACATEHKILNHYGRMIYERFYPYVLLTPAVVHCVSDSAILGVTPEVLQAIVRDVAKSVKELGITRVMVLTACEAELEAAKRGLDSVDGIKKHALGIWQFYPKIDELEGEDPLGKGGPYLTSQMMHIDRGYVKEGMLKYADQSFGIVGDPKKGSSEIGKTIAERVTESLIAESDAIMRG